MNITNSFTVPKEFIIDISRVNLGVYDFYLSIYGMGFDTGEPLNYTYDDVPDESKYEDYNIAIEFLVDKYNNVIQNKIDIMINRILNEIKFEKEIGWSEDEEN